MLERHNASEGATARLRHTAWAPTSVTHPRLGELYFGSILNRHAATCSTGDAHSVFGAMPPTERPYQCEWADGGELTSEEIAELLEVHKRATWRVQLHAGDLVVIDNLRFAHGRTPYVGSRLMGLLIGRMVEREAHRLPPPAFSEWRRQRLSQQG